MEGSVQIDSEIVCIVRWLLVLKLPKTTPSGLIMGTILIIVVLSIYLTDLLEWSISLRISPSQTYEETDSPGWIRLLTKISFLRVRAVEVDDVLLLLLLNLMWPLSSPLLLDDDLQQQLCEKVWPIPAQVSLLVRVTIGMASPVKL